MRVTMWRGKPPPISTGSEGSGGKKKRQHDDAKKKEGTRNSRKDLLRQEKESCVHGGRVGEAEIARKKKRAAPAKQAPTSMHAKNFD